MVVWHIWRPWNFSLRTLRLRIIKNYTVSYIVSSRTSQVSRWQRNKVRGGFEGRHDNMAQEASRTHPSLLSGRVDDRLGSEEKQDPWDLSTVIVAVNKNKGALSAHVAQGDVGINGVGLPSLGQIASQLFTPHFYQRLPNPVSHLLKELWSMSPMSTFCVSSC